MKILEVTDRTPDLINRLLEVWEGSVRATHLFLSDDEIRQIQEYVPQALPPVLSQLGPDFSLTLKVIVSAEVMCSTFNSLGGLIYQSNVFLDTAQMFALTICTLAVGGLCEWALSKLVLLTKKWRGEERGAQNDNI